MTVPSIEPLTADHIANFDVPSGFPFEVWEGKAVAAVKEGKVLGVCGVIEKDDTATVGMFLSPEMRENGVFLTRTVLRGIQALQIKGFKRIRARAETSTSERWLTRLGFVVQDDGWYELCLA